MTRLLRLLILSVCFTFCVLVAYPAAAAVWPTYVIAFIPLNWSGGLDAFEAEARQQGEFFVSESSIGDYASVELKFIRERFDGASLTDPWLVQDVVAFSLTREPADRYVGLTDGDLALDGNSRVVGWTMGPESPGIVIETGSLAVTAHELGHTYGLCDEYYFPYWDEQNHEWGCPTPFPPECSQFETEFCDGLPAPDGSNSIMGPSGLAGPYSYYTPSLDHLQMVFASLFASGDPPPEPTPVPPTPEPIPPSPTPEPAPIDRSIVVVDPALVRLDPNGMWQRLASGPALQPDWSPDGERIAFASTHSGNLDLYLVSASGGVLQRLTDSPARGFHPAWLPDGARLIFVSDTTGASALYTLDLDSRAVEPLADLPTPASWPALSQDGRALAFSAAPTGDWDIYRVDLDVDGMPLPDTLTRLTDSPGPDISPAWGLDSTSLAFASGRAGSLDLYLLTAANSGAVAITNSPGNEWAPRWLADGRIVYHAYDGQALGVWALDPNTGKQIPIAPDMPLAAWPAPEP